MYKNLSPKALGITGRQSEIVELALTYGFRGLDLDINDFSKRLEHRGLDHTTRFIRSAQIKLGGFELPIRWRGDEAVFKGELVRLEEQATQASAAGARTCFVSVFPATDTLPYHENFEMHRHRLAEIADTLGRHQIRLGVGFLAAPAHRHERQFQFIQEAEPLVTLIKSIGNKNIGLMLDTWNWHFGAGTLELLKTVGGAGVVTVHLADAPPDAQRATLTDEQRLMPKAEGVVDNVALLGLLNELGFRGPVTPVPHPRCFTGMTRDAIVQQCGAALDGIWKAIGLPTTRFGKFAAAAAE